MIGSFPVMIGEAPLRIVFPNTSQLTTKLAIYLVNPLCGHRVDQEIGQCPNQRIYPIRRVTGRTGQNVAVRIGGKGAHLILQLREHSQMVHPALLVERRNRFCASYLSPGSTNGREGRVWLDHSQRRFDHVAAIVYLGYNSIGPVRAISRNSSLGPFRRLIATRGVSEYPTSSAGILAGDNNAGFISPLSRARRWIDRDNYSC